MHLCVFVTWGNKAIDITSLINIFMHQSTVRNWKIQGKNTLELEIRIGIIWNNTIGKHPLPNQNFFIGFKSFNSDSVLSSIVFWSGTIVSSPLAKGVVKVSGFSKIGKKGEEGQG